VQLIILNVHLILVETASLLLSVFLAAAGDPINWGLVISSVIAAAASYLGYRIGSSKDVQLAQLDDRGKLTNDLMKRLDSAEHNIEELNKKLQEANKDIDTLQYRELMLVRFFSNIGAELRFVSAQSQLHGSMLKNPHAVDVEALQRSSQLMCEGLDRIARIVDKEEEWMSLNLRSGAASSKTLSSPEQ
jgi:hypothetical protein